MSVPSLKDLTLRQTVEHILEMLNNPAENRQEVLALVSQLYRTFGDDIEDLDEKLASLTRRTTFSALLRRISRVYGLPLFRVIRGGKKHVRKRQIPSVRHSRYGG